MNKLQKKALAATLIACWSGCVAALSEEEELALVYGDKETVSIATGSKQPLRRAPAVASVVTAEEIAAMGARTLDEALEGVVGIHVSRSPVRYASIMIIRGIGGGGPTNPQVLLLQNGIPLTTMYNGDKGAAWNSVPLENVARIEIIRGPGSALYGADAYSGVINIITKTAAESAGTKYGLRAGSFNSRDGWVQHGGKWGEVEVATYLSLRSTDGIQETISADTQTANDKKYGTAASLAPGSVNTGYNAVDGSLDLSLDKWRFRTAYKLRDKLETGAGINSALDPTSKGRAENLLTDLSWNDPQFARDWSVGGTASALYYILTYPNNVMLLPPGAKVGDVLSPTYFPDGMIGGPNQWEREFRVSAFATYSGLENHNLRFGAGHDNLDMYKTRTNKNYMFNADGVPSNPGPVLNYTNIQPHIMPHLRKVDYLVVQDEWNFAKDWNMTAGVRHDRYSDFGGTTNPRLALVWDASLNLTAKLLYGQAFRAPSFNEQYGINPVVNGNPNLKPETMRTLEAAFDWQALRDTQVNLSLFRYDMHDIISSVPNPTMVNSSTYQNSGSQHGSGVELEAAWDAGRSLRLSGNYAYQRSIEEASGQDVGYAPHHHFYARADWRVARDWLLSPQINRVADRRRASKDSRAAVPDYTTFDLTARVADSYSQWDFVISVRNLFDADVREPTLTPGTALPNDLPMAPRELWMQAVYKM